MKQTAKINALLRSGRTLLDVRTLGALLGAKPESAWVLASRLVDQGMLERLRRDLYLPVGATVFPFEIANALFQPSYVSFESALNRWGVIAQVPVSVTSAASRSSRTMIRGQEFLFRRLPDRVLDAGWVKDGRAYVATPEKALLDSLYLRSKGLMSLEPADVDSRKLDRKKLESLIRLFPATFIRNSAPFLEQIWEGYAGVQ